jgi:ATPase subunit of ABC transporter with duplicated ATPase domains
MTFVTLDAVTCRSPDGRTLFENLTLSLGAQRTGLVGRNGVGKTTLLRVILGEAAPAAGSVSVGGRIAVLRQTLAPAPGATLGDLLGVSDQLARLERLDRGEAAVDDLDLADWTLPARLEAALGEMGLERMSLDRAAASLSGGEATRAALAGLLVGEPDLILLDEPTNNLDVAARAAVGAMLERWKGGALVVSHDRSLLRRMDRIVELSSLGARVYGGDYDLYAERKAEEAAAAARDLDEAERTAARVSREAQALRERKARKDAAGKRSRARGDAPKMLLDFKAGRAEASGGRQSRLAERQGADAAAALEDAQARVERVKALAFDLPRSGLAAGKLVLAFDNVSFAWPGRPPLLADLSLRLSGPERLAVVGANGAGKSTLIKLAIGDLRPTAGGVTLGVDAALLDQHASLLRADETLVAGFRRLNPEASANDAHAALARFLFRGEAALKPVAALSGGERLRAALACVLMSAAPPRLIILDEPTNHLDLDSIAAMEAALRGYDGALLVVSHDADFLAAIGVTRTLSLARSA